MSGSFDSWSPFYVSFLFTRLLYFITDAQRLLSSDFEHWAHERKRRVQSNQAGRAVDVDLDRIEGNINVR